MSVPLKPDCKDIGIFTQFFTPTPNIPQKFGIMTRNALRVGKKRRFCKKICTNRFATLTFRLV
ncbi:MAG: hypothetical protein EAZ92_05850 [Candidatus Kapaibacterium sp.]|nr:MAG: hypothetical protein EAZ92_05850 [Candidatus Kapabacteria bacterium]